MKKEKRKEGRANGASLACGLNAATFPPKRNLKVGKPLLLVVTATLIAVNETSCATLALSIFHRVTVRNRVSQVIPLPSNTLPTFPPFHSRPGRSSLSFPSSFFGDIDTDFPTYSFHIYIFFYLCHVRYQRPFCRVCSARYSFVASVSVADSMYETASALKRVD